MPLLPLLAALSLPSPARAAGWSSDPGTNLGLPAPCEPSGVIWHERYEDLFVVWDNGWVMRLEADGSGAYTDAYVGYDLEGIALVDPSSDNLYLGIEYPAAIREYAIAAEALTGDSWDLSGSMPDTSSDGLEALTFVPDGHHPYGDTRSGGLFYAGCQYDAGVYVFDVNLSSSGDVDFVDQFATPYPRDLAGLHYDVRTRTLYAAIDDYNVLLEMKTDGTILATYSLPATSTAQEGVFFVRDSPSTCVAWIAQDSGGVMEYADYGVLDTDGDGLTDAEEHWHDGAAGYTRGSDTDPEAPDTDLDSFTDYVESQSGTDPLDNGDAPEVLRVNFQPFASASPSGGGYCIDAGTAKASTGYGW